MPNPKLTTELLALALRGLAVSGPAGDEESSSSQDEITRELAEQALSGIAVCLKFLLAKHGEAKINGFGAFSVTDGAITFHPEESLLQYVLLSEPKPGTSRAEIIARNLLHHLKYADSAIPLIKDNLDTRLTLDEFTAEDHLLGTIFGELPEKKLSACVEYLLQSIIAQFAEADITLDVSRSAVRASSIEFGETVIGREESRDDFTSFLDRSKEAVRRQKEQLNAAFEAGKQPYREEKGKQS